MMLYDFSSVFDLFENTIMQCVKVGAASVRR